MDLNFTGFRASLAPSLTALWGLPLAGALLLLGALNPSPLQAQDAWDDLTEEERALIEEALGEDAPATSPATGTATPAPLPAPSATAPLASAPRSPRVLQQMNPDIALILDTAFAAFSEADNLQSGAHDPQSNGFNLQQLEMSIGSSVDPFFRMDANLVFSQFGVEVEEAYATTLSLPANLQVRAGQFLTKMGRINPTHPHSWSFVDQPFFWGKVFGAEGSRGLGAEVSWLTPLPWFTEILLSSTAADGACCARSFFGAEAIGVLGPRDLLYTLAIDQFFPMGPSLSLNWGLGMQQGPNPSGNGNRSQILGTDLYLRYRPVNSPVRRAVSLQVEMLHRQRQIIGDVLTDYGGYGHLVYNHNIRWETGFRYEFGSGVESDPLDPAWSSDRRRYQGQLTYYPSHFSRLRLEGSVDVPTWREEPIVSAFLALEVLIGAHGAHSF